MVIYEVTGTDMAIAPEYLARLNNPTPWTSAMMPRFRGMVRGFCTVTAGAGFGLGHAALSLRFTPAAGRAADLGDWLARDVRSEEHTSELQSLMRISYAVFCLKKKKHTNHCNMIRKNRTIRHRQT